MQRLSALLLASAVALVAAEPAALLSPANRVDPADARWKEIAAEFAKEPEIMATFEERRQFGFTSQPQIVSGKSFVSTTRGLSLQYLEPEEYTMIIDGKGVVIRRKGSEQKLPADPRIAAANEALLHILRFDLAALSANFDLYGETRETGWRLGLVPRSRPMQQAYASISVAGRGNSVERIELQRSARNSIEILLKKLGPPSAADLQQVFR